MILSICLPKSRCKYLGRVKGLFFGFPSHPHNSGASQAWLPFTLQRSDAVKTTGPRSNLCFGYRHLFALAKLPSYAQASMLRSTARNHLHAHAPKVETPNFLASFHILTDLESDGVSDYYS
eukprot:scaffold162117_cov16-Tisochrysis_lutea.AAC.1